MGVWECGGMGGISRPGADDRAGGTAAAVGGGEGDGGNDDGSAEVGGDAATGRDEAVSPTCCFSGGTLCGPVTAAAAGRPPA